MSDHTVRFDKPTRQQILNARAALMNSRQMFELRHDGDVELDDGDHCTDNELVEAVLGRWEVGQPANPWAGETDWGKEPIHESVVRRWGKANWLSYFVHARAS